ncbi:MAG: ATP-binding protein, partial [Pseudobdellovibrio sp.]
MTEKKVESIKEKATTIAHTLRAIYTYTRMQVSAPPETIKLKSFCEQILNTFSYPTEDYQVETAVNIDPKLAIKTMPNFLEQILKSLIQNAIESLADTGHRKLEIECHPSGEQMTLTVKDSGPAVEADVVPKLFKPFFSTKKEHFGLGLAQASTLAKFINGQIKYEYVDESNCVSLILEKDGPGRA